MFGVGWRKWSVPEGEQCCSPSVCLNPKYVRLENSSIGTEVQQLNVQLLVYNGNYGASPGLE